MKVNYPETILKRTTGSTGSERYLHKLCQQSFLSMWSYSNIFRDQGRQNINADGKEVCDLLVVFENHVLIFSDKDCAFPKGNDLKLSWVRWYRKAIHKSANQIFGAERWLTDYKDKIFLDKSCKTKFPIDLPDPEAMKIHRIVVTHGTFEQCKEIFGGSGSLMYNGSISTTDNLNIETAVPFTIGRNIDHKDFFHILDDVSLEILLQTLDTISDFIHYLEKKEELFARSTLIVAAGEEELLASYLFNINDNNEHFFPGKDESSLTTLIFNEGEWLRFQNHKQRIAQIKANKISYLWDTLIEKFTGHIFDGTSDFLSHADISEQEKCIRVLAKENRTRRRMLSESLVGILEKTPENQRATRTILPTNPNEPCYVFLILPRHSNKDDEQYRKFRRQLLTDYCYIKKLSVPQAKFIIGFATEHRTSEFRSEDLTYIDTSKWSEEDSLKAAEIKLELKEKRLLGETQWITSAFSEFPYDDKVNKFNNIKGKDRNQPCFCGSGSKFKKCCGKSN